MEREDKNKIDEIRNTINPRRYISSRLLKNEKLDEMISMAKTYRDAFAGQVNVRFDDKSFERMLEADDGTITEIQKVIEKYQKKYTENMELYCICEMALRYLEKMHELED